MASSDGFAAASHREAALRGAPASPGETAFRGAAGGSVRPAAAMRSTHREMRCSAAVQAARYRAARRAAMRSAHCEIRPGENVTLQYLSHDGRPAPRPQPPLRFNHRVVRSPSWRVSSAFIRTGSTTGRSSCWTGRRAFSKAAVARACWERGVSKSVVLLTGDRGFESISLQQRVHCEPDFLGCG
jgi:hypothetical protein